MFLRRSLGPQRFPKAREFDHNRSASLVECRFPSLNNIRDHRLQPTPVAIGHLGTNPVRIGGGGLSRGDSKTSHVVSRPTTPSSEARQLPNSRQLSWNE